MERGKAMRKLVLLLLLVMLLTLAGCGEESSPGAGAGSAEAGEKVLREVAAPACTSCHSLEPGVSLAGPSLAGIGAQAGNRVAGMSAEEYLRESIVEPGTFVVEGFGNIMADTYGSQLSRQQINDLIAYLLTLK
jgi:nitric oxide reductase subunit C